MLTNTDVLKDEVINGRTVPTLDIEKLKWNHISEFMGSKVANAWGLKKIPRADVKKWKAYIEVNHVYAAVSTSYVHKTMYA